MSRMKLLASTIAVGCLTGASAKAASVATPTYKLVVVENGAGASSPGDGGGRQLARAEIGAARIDLLQACRLPSSATEGLHLLRIRFQKRPEAGGTSTVSRPDHQPLEARLWLFHT